MATRDGFAPTLPKRKNMVEGAMLGVVEEMKMRQEKREGEKS